MFNACWQETALMAIPRSLVVTHWAFSFRIFFGAPLSLTLSPLLRRRERERRRGALARLLPLLHGVGGGRGEEGILENIQHSTFNFEHSISEIRRSAAGLAIEC